MAPTLVRDVSASQLALQLGVDEEITACFLRAVQQHEPEAMLRVTSRGSYSRASIYFDFEDVLTLATHKGFVTIDCGGGFPGEQYFVLIPLDSVTDDRAALLYVRQIPETQIVHGRFELQLALTNGLAPAYARLATLRQATRNEHPMTGVRRWLGRLRSPLTI